jgi:hypothetical protein
VSEYFQVQAVTCADRELVLRVEVIDGNADGFSTARNVAVLLAIDANWKCGLARDVARQFGFAGDLYDDDGAVDRLEKALGTIAVDYVEKVEIIATEKLPLTAETFDSGAIQWERDGEQIGCAATYRLLFTKPQWVAHIRAGDSWTSMAYDVSYAEESERAQSIEVLERQGATIVLRAKPILEFVTPAPASARFALGVLIERARVTPRTFGDSLPDLEVHENDVMTEAAPEYIASVTERERDGDTVTLEIVVKDPATIAAFEVGMRWSAFGFE